MWIGERLTSGRLAPSMDQARRVHARRADAMCSALERYLGDAVRFSRPGGGLFVWARLSDGSDATHFAARAIAQGVAFVPGAPFFANAPDPGSFRLSFATASEEAIAEGVSRLAKAL